jgi:hypothetical protein
MITYGQSIEWTSFDGSKTKITIDGCETADRARNEAVRFAKEQGWTPPRWWQFWRWNDTRINLEH